MAIASRDQWRTRGLRGGRYGVRRTGTLLPRGLPAGGIPRTVRWAFLLFIFTLPFEAMELGLMRGMLSLGRIGGLLFFALYFFYYNAFSAKRSFPRFPRGMLWILGYVVVFALNGFFLPAEFVGAFVTRLFTLIQLLVLLWVASDLLTEERMAREVLYAYIMAATVLAFGSMLQLPGFAAGVGSVAGTRAAAFGFNPNTLATLMALAAIMLTGLLFGAEPRVHPHPSPALPPHPDLPPRRGEGEQIRQGGGDLMPTLVSSLRERTGGPSDAGGSVLLAYAKKLVFGALMLPLLAVLVQTGSRTGVAAFASGFVVYQLPYRHSRPRVTALLIAALGGLTLVYMVANSSIAASRWEQTLYEGNVAGRDKIALAALELMQERPLFGWQPIRFWYQLGDRVGLFGEMRDAHNLFLHLFLEVGVVGALPFLIGLGLCGRAAWRARWGNLGLLPLALLVTTLAANMANTDLVRKHLWIVLAFTLAAAAAARRRRRRSIK